MERLVAPCTRRLEWAKLLNDTRLPKEGAASEGAQIQPEWLVNSRIEAERDFDRLLFATPTRRLGDKTQVFPLDKNESVRTRLTHSHEVANLARSIGTHIVYSSRGSDITSELSEIFGNGSAELVKRRVPAILATIGLAHDLGNPPFGHQGEEAIRSWIVRNSERVFSSSESQLSGLGESDKTALVDDLRSLQVSHKEDFRKFEGNAQTLRTLCRLQVVKDNRGLNLTLGTLAASMKYTVGSDRVAMGDNRPIWAKKFGYFSSETALVSNIRKKTGLFDDLRHPLTYIMEACDDIAYLIVDAEDAVKKQIVSFHDLMAWLEPSLNAGSDPVTCWVVDTAKKGAGEAKATKLPPSEINDVSMQIFRANAITAMISAVVTSFDQHYEAIMTTGIALPLLELSAANDFSKRMRDFDFEHAYRNRRVLEIELDGFNTIQGLMDLLWRGIVEREQFMAVDSRRTSPFARYAYGRISENYRRVFERRLPASGFLPDTLPIRYRELQLLTDMVAGMTDQFAIDLFHELNEFNVGASAT